MKKLFFRLPENTSPQAHSAFMIAALIAAIHVIAAPYYLYLGWTLAIAQFNSLAAISFSLGVLVAIGAFSSRAERPTQGMILVLSIIALSYPPISTLVAGLGTVLGLALMIAGPMIAFQVLRGRSAWVMTAATIVAGLATFLMDLLGSMARPSLPGLFIQLLAVSVLGTLVYFIVRGYRQIQSSVSYKLISVVVIVLAVIMSFQVLFSNRSTRQNILQEAEDVLASHYVSYETKIEAEGLAAEALAIGIASRNDVQELFLSGDRNALYDLLAPMFAQWKDRQIVHLYIENPDGTVFLRVHNPEKFGDDITYRGTANTALTERRVTSGVEIGPNRLGVRGVAPMYTPEGQFIGLVEVGVDFDTQFVADLKSNTGADFTMWVLHDAATVPNLKPAEGVPSAPIEELFFYTGTSSEASLVSPDAYRSVLVTGDPVFQALTENILIPSTVYITPLRGYEGKLLGLLQISEPYTDHLRAQNAALVVSLSVTGGLAALALFLIWLFGTRVVIQPLNLLSQFATRQMAGETGLRVSVPSKDEFHQLAETFNALATSVEEERMKLERRVAERTQSLELAAEIGRSVSQVRELHVMLQDACELIQKEFDLYYVQVYLTNPHQRKLVLEAGTGQVGAQLRERGHSLQLSTGSINGRAAVEQRTVVISDTAQSAIFRPNPLLPETRGEMAMPLIVADSVVGVLDIQANRPGTLTEDILPAFEALAGQLAVAIQNAKLLEEAEQAQADVEAQTRRLVRTGWAEYLDAIHKPEQLGFVFDHNEISPLAETEEPRALEDVQALAAPISLTGETFGSLVVELAASNQDERASELVTIMAHQVAQQIENLRLLDSAERYRFEAERAVRLQTIEGWQRYINTRPEGSLGYLYDLKEVRPNGNGKHGDPSMLVLPLKARDEMIGKLSIHGLTEKDQASVDLVNAVAERLGAHIENLRLFEETRRGQVELDKRAKQLAAVAEISNVSSKELDIQKMLESVVRLTQHQFGLYHAHVFLYSEHKEELTIAACGWKDDSVHEGTHETAIIPLGQEQSLVARAARTRKAVIVNNVFGEPGWLPNPLLPDTVSEMAVPLVLGDQLLGVLDVQADRVNAFTEEDANIQTTLASQVATALQNARSFTQAQKQAEREAMLNVINQKIQSATSVEAVLQIAARELGHALDAPMTIAQLSMKDKSS